MIDSPTGPFSFHLITILDWVFSFGLIDIGCSHFYSMFWFGLDVFIWIGCSDFGMDVRIWVVWRPIANTRDHRSTARQVAVRRSRKHARQTNIRGHPSRLVESWTHPHRHWSLSSHSYNNVTMVDRSAYNERRLWSGNLAILWQNAWFRNVQYWLLPTTVIIVGGNILGMWNIRCVGRRLTERAAFVTHNNSNV